MSRYGYLNADTNPYPSYSPSATTLDANPSSTTSSFPVVHLELESVHHLVDSGSSRRHYMADVSVENIGGQ